MLPVPKMRAGQLLLPAWLGVVLVTWQYLASGRFSFAGSAFVLSIPLGAFFLGDLFLKFVTQDNERFDNLPARLVCGIILADVLLYVSVLLLPVGPGAGWGLIFCAALGGWILARRKQGGGVLAARIGPEEIFLFLAPLAVTLWCRALLSPPQVEGATVVISGWLDIFYHVSEIVRFAASRGFGTISDLHMAGGPAVLYHHASYMLPGALVDATGVSGVTAYAGLFVPWGLLVAGLGAYALAGAVFGRWPALAGGLALLVLPDAAQQVGLDNAYFGYNWMLQATPACGYGLAAAAIVFMLLHEACRTGRPALVAAAYAFVFFTLLHKAQIFFAIAYLALIFPVLFMPGPRLGLRGFALLALPGIYWTVIAVAQAMPGMPVIRLDGSGLMTYSGLILYYQTDGPLKQGFRVLFASSAHSWPGRAAAFALLLAIASFGFSSLLYLTQARQLRRTEEARVWLFPLLVVTLYLVGATCLALDDRRVGGPEELLHRPFMWAYFVLVVWGAAAFYRRICGDAAPASRTGQRSLLAVTPALLLLPAVFGTGVEDFPGGSGGHQWLPAGQIAVADYIRAHSAPSDLVQTVQGANGLVLFALSERPAYALTTQGVRNPAGLQARLEALAKINRLRDIGQVEAFMRQNSIRWYVVNPRDKVQWADTIGPPAFARGGYRVYRF